jgi:TPR repeat protein
MDLKKALECYFKAAKGGNVEAMVNLGHMLEKVHNTFEASELAQFSEKSPFETAFRWYMKASEQGYARAQNALGSCYYWGKGIEQDYNNAIVYYRLAAEQNDPHACNNLGVCYEEGNGVPKDLGMAKLYYKKAAEMHHPSGITNLAYILLLENNIWEAFKNFHVGVSLGSAEAAYQLGTLYEVGCDDEKFFLASDIRMALFYYQEAVNQVHFPMY